MVLGINSRIPSITDLVKQVDKKLLNNQLLGDWNIYDSKTNKQIAKFDTFLSYDYSDSVSVMSHPIENGSFACYNKVIDPASISISLAKSGFPFEIRDILEVLEKYKDSTDLIDIVTPHRTYLKYTINSMSHAIRESGAVNLLVIQLGLSEVKEVELGYKTVGLSASKVSNGDYADTKDSGKKTTKEPKKSLLMKGIDWGVSKI